MDDDLKQDDPAQSQRFIDMAEESGISEVAEEFEKVFRKLSEPEKADRNHTFTRARKPESK